MDLQFCVADLGKGQAKEDSGGRTVALASQTVPLLVSQRPRIPQLAFRCLLGILSLSQFCWFLEKREEEKEGENFQLLSAAVAFTQSLCHLRSLRIQPQ